jgi:hypothetical protein
MAATARFFWKGAKRKEHWTNVAIAEFPDHRVLCFLESTSTVSWRFSAEPSCEVFLLLTFPLLPYLLDCSIVELSIPHDRVLDAVSMQVSLA